MALLSLLAYPLIVIGNTALALLVYNHTQNLFLSSFSATLGFVSLTMLFEYLIPFRQEWKPAYSPESVKNTKLNILYMVSSFVFQEFAVKAVIFSLLIPAIAWLAGTQHHSVFAQIWPHHWHWLPQVLLLYLLTDFNNYWLHRGMHEWHKGWAMHKLHHSLQQLNWSASARLHVFEHFFNAGPRILVLALLGIRPEVVLVYFMYNNALGFLVHSNIALNTRWLNYILYMPDHHRFHHSQVIREANSNYSGPTILWDQVFGTFYLPNRKGPAVLGLDHDDDIPVGMRRYSFWKNYLIQFLSPLAYWTGIPLTKPEKQR